MSSPVVFVRDGGEGGGDGCNEQEGGGGRTGVGGVGGSGKKGEVLRGREDRAGEAKKETRSLARSRTWASELLQGPLDGRGRALLIAFGKIGREKERGC
jgi:hypothetical protein